VRLLHPSQNPGSVRNNAVDGGNYILCAFEGLTTLGKDGTIVAGTAERWETSDDGLFGHSTSQGCKVV